MSTPTTIYQLDKPTVSGDADAWGGLLNTNLDDLDTFLGKPRLKKNAPSVGATTTLDLALANFFEFTVGQATTLSITNVPATLPDTTVPAIRVFLKIRDGGAFVITWPGSIVWPFETANAAPTGLANPGVDVIELVSYDAGVTWYAMLLHIKVSPNLDPRASVYKSANQALTSGLDVLTFDTEKYDVGVMHDNVTNNSRLTVPANQGGLYHIVGRLNLNNETNLNFHVRKNGSTFLYSGEPVAARSQVISIYEVLAAGDYVQLLADSNSFPIALSGIAATAFEIVRVR